MGGDVAAHPDPHAGLVRQRSLRELPGQASETVKRDPRRSEPAIAGSAAFGYGPVTGRGINAKNSRTAVNAHADSENVAPSHSAAAVAAVRRKTAGLISASMRSASVRAGCGAQQAVTAAGLSTKARSPRAAGALGDITNVIHANGAPGLPNVTVKSARGAIQQQQNSTQGPSCAHQAQQRQPLQPLPTQSQPLQPQPAGQANAAVTPRTAKVSTPRTAAQPLPVSARRTPAPTPPTPFPTEEADFNKAFRDDGKNIQYVNERISQVHTTMFEDEVKFMPRQGFMQGQPDINPKMRGILLDWLVEVHQRYQLRSETLYLAASLIDRFLATRPVLRKRLQLIGVVCMFIASKFEEIDPPKVTEFAYITDNTYAIADIVSMECTVLTALDFQIAVPTQVHFSDRFVRANGCNDLHKALVNYIMELGLMDVKLSRYPPSHIVAAALLLSNEVMEIQPLWPASIQYHTRRKEAELRTCVDELRVQVENAGSSRGSLQAVRKKYQLEEHFTIANLISPSPVATPGSGNSGHSSNGNRSRTCTTLGQAPATTGRSASCTAQAARGPSRAASGSRGMTANSGYASSTRVAPGSQCP